MGVVEGVEGVSNRKKVQGRKVVVRTIKISGDGHLTVRTGQQKGARLKHLNPRNHQPHTNKHKHTTTLASIGVLTFHVRDHRFPVFRYRFFTV